jgi:hypothetical protein
MTRREGFVASYGIPLGVVLLVLWALATFAWEGPGWVHLFLTLGVFLVIWGIVARGDPRPPQ